MFRNLCSAIDPQLVAFVTYLSACLRAMESDSGRFALPASACLLAVVRLTMDIVSKLL